MAYLTNVFYSPFNPVRTLYITTSWQAIDPLIHYTVSDLQDPMSINRVRTDNLFSQQRISNIGRINDRYEPWGGSPVHRSSSTTIYDIRVKDPQVWRADDWDFPEGKELCIESLGRIHRGTPWQTLYLKSPAVDPLVWERWSGVADPANSERMRPTNDWRLVSSLIPLLVKEQPHRLVSVNEASISDWQSVLKGMHVLTNTLSDDQLLATAPQFDSLVMHSKSPQIQTIIADIDATRASLPSSIWSDRGDILATPALSVNSPWLNQSSPIQLRRGVTDEAYEKIPSQLLQLLRSDSIGSVSHLRQGIKARFTGITGSHYALETSSDLVNWITISTNYPLNGFLEFSDEPPDKGHNRFYRSVLLP